MHELSPAGWRTLADDAIADAARWKAKARKAQGQRDALLAALRDLTHQIEIGTLFDQYGHSAKMLKAYAAIADAGEAPEETPK